MYRELWGTVGIRRGKKALSLWSPLRLSSPWAEDWSGKDLVSRQQPSRTSPAVQQLSPRPRPRPEHRRPQPLLPQPSTPSAWAPHTPSGDCLPIWQTNSGSSLPPASVFRSRRPCVPRAPTPSSKWSECELSWRDGACIPESPVPSWSAPPLHDGMSSFNALGTLGSRETPLKPLLVVNYLTLIRNSLYKFLLFKWYRLSLLIGARMIPLGMRQRN